MKITSGIPFNSAIITVTLENGLAIQAPPQIFVEINGPGFFASRTLAISSQATEILSFRDLPSLGFVSVTEDSSDVFDQLSGVWRGSAAGQRNTLKFSIQPNLDVFPGAIFTISGLVRTNSSVSKPTIRQQPKNLLSNLTVYSWLPNDGILILIIQSVNLDGPAIIGSMQNVSFGVEFDTPCVSSTISSACQSSLLSTQYPTIAIEATRLGPKRTCSSLKQNVNGQVFIPKQSSNPFFFVHDDQPINLFSRGMRCFYHFDFIKSLCFWN